MGGPGPAVVPAPMCMLAATTTTLHVSARQLEDLRSSVRERRPSLATIRVSSASNMRRCTPYVCFNSLRKSLRIHHTLGRASSVHHPLRRRFTVIVEM